MRKVKLTPSRVIVGLIVVVISIPVMLGGSWIAYCGYQSVALKQQAKDKENRLNDMTILNDNRHTSTGIPSGDCITGDTKSVKAQTFLNLSGQFGPLENEISNNISNSGFKRVEAVEYYYDGSADVILGSNSRQVAGITRRYDSEKETIYITYNFSKNYECPTWEVCRSAHELNNIPQDQIHNLPSFSTNPIKSIEVNLSDRKGTRYF